MMGQKVKGNTYGVKANTDTAQEAPEGETQRLAFKCCAENDVSAVSAT